MIRQTLRGYGCLVQIMDLTERLHIQNPLIVGKGTMVSVLKEKVSKLADAPVFAEYHSNPDLKDCEIGLKLFRENHCDGFIAIGGGSCMDTAKSIKALMMAGSLENVINGQYSNPELPPMIAVPTTAGTGSEATQFAVVYVKDEKLSLNHPRLQPEGVVLDPELLKSVPEYHQKACALDALAQGIESYWAVSANEDSRAHSFMAILGVLDNLKAYLAGDDHAAEAMLEAAFESGCAIQMTRTTAAHAMSYQVTKKLGLAHGHACMLTLPALWEVMVEDTFCKPVLNELSKRMRLAKPQMGAQLLWGILYDMGLESRKELDEALLDELTNTINLERLANHPMKMGAEQLKAVYRRAFQPQTEEEKLACIDLWKKYGV